jgi:hypothetical protein
VSHWLVKIKVKRGVGGFDQIAFDERRHIVGGAEANNDLKRVGGAAVEQHARGRVDEHAPIGLDKTTHLFNRRIEIGVVCNLKTYLPGMWRRGINAEISQGLAPDATVWHEQLHFVVGDQLRPE